MKSLPARVQASAFGLLVMVLLLGCEAGTPKNADETESPDEVVAGPASTSPESEAREKLKTMLDAWVFGDDWQKIQNDHADIDFTDFEIVSKKLMRYEIGPVRSVPTSDSTMKHCELAVTLIFESKGGTEIKNARKYKAYWFSRDNKWHISATP